MRWRKVHFTPALHQLWRLYLNGCAYDLPSPRSVLVMWIATVTAVATETTTKCVWAKLHVPNICSGQNDMVKFTQAVAVTEV